MQLNENISQYHLIEQCSSRVKFLAGEYKWHKILKSVSIEILIIYTLYQLKARMTVLEVTR